jgi:hypothetical protein
MRFVLRREGLRDPATADDWREQRRVAFVPVKEARGQGRLSSGYMEDLGRRRCLGRPDYFDRYFAFSVPDEDIADSVVAAALSE